MSTPKIKLIVRFEPENHELLKWAAKLSGKSMNQTLNDLVADITNHKVKYLNNAISSSPVLNEAETRALAEKLNQRAEAFEKKSKDF